MDLKVVCTQSNGQCTEELKVEVSFNLTNSGTCEGSEIIQLYVAEGKENAVWTSSTKLNNIKTSDIKLSIIRPSKALKGFNKINLKPGQTKKISLTLDQSAFMHYDTDQKQWQYAPRQITLLIGASSQDIRLSQVIEL